MCLVFSDANDWHGTLFHSDFLADRVDAGKEIFEEYMPACKRGGTGEIGIGDVAALDEVHVVELGHLWVQARRLVSFKS